jgi:hypothetical protein
MIPITKQQRNLKTIEEVEAGHTTITGGHQIIPKAKNVKRVRCAGSKGYGTTWKYPRAKGRIFREPRRRIITEMVDKAVGGTGMVKGGGCNRAAGSGDSYIPEVTDVVRPAKPLTCHEAVTAAWT